MHVADQRGRPREVVEPVVEHELLTEDRDRRQRRGQLGRPEQVDAAPAAGEALEPLDHGGHRHRDGERREREVEAREPQRRDAEEEADDAGDERRDRDRPDVLDAVVGHQDRRRVAPDRHERAVAE